MATQKQQTVPQFSLANGEFVAIPDSLFIYSNFLREYKKAMLAEMTPESSADLIIPLPTIPPGQTVTRQHLNTMAQFFDLYTRHNYGAGSSSTRKVPSAIDLHRAFANIGNQKSGNVYSAKQQQVAFKQQKEGIEQVNSGTDLAEMEAKSDAKTPGLPDWAHGFFSALDKDFLIVTANIANFLSATQFVEHLANFLALKCREMDSSYEIMDFLNFAMEEDPEGEELRNLLYEDFIGDGKEKGMVASGGEPETLRNDEEDEANAKTVSTEEGTSGKDEDEDEEEEDESQQTRTDSSA